VTPLRVGLVTSVGRTLDAFFPRIAQRLTEHGCTVTAASGTASALPGWTLLPGLTQRPSAASPHALGQLRRWSRVEAHDVVVTSTATASALVRLAGLRAPVGYFCHGLHWGGRPGRGDRAWQLLEAALLHRTAGVLTLNGEDEQWFRARLPDDAVHRLAAGVGVPLASYPAAAVPDGPLRLLWAGDLTPRKRPLLAVAVARELARLGVPATLQVLGDGALLPAVRTAVDVAHLGTTVTTPGRGDVAAALAGSSALLHTAEWEGLPRVALEAAAVGRWTYGFDVKGLRDAPLVRLVPDADPAALARRLRDDAADGSLARVPDVRAGLDVDAAADAVHTAVRAIVARAGQRGR
jgi:glycosyltransferase involved in cell wall biosynthesis